MAVVKDTIKASLVALYTEAQAGMSDADFADSMATIIAAAILSATVNPGITVQVTPATGTGATTGPGALS